GKHFNEKIRQIGFLLALVFLACLIIGELQYFVSSVLGGFTIFLILRKPQRYLLNKGWGNTFTTTVLLIATFIFLLLLTGGFTSILYGKLKSFQPQTLVEGLQHIRDFIIEKWGYNIFSQDVIQKVVSAVGSILPGILSATGNVVANVIMMMFVLFFMLQQRASFERSMDRFIPFSRDSILLLKSAIHTMVISNAVGIPLILFGQALTAGLAYWVLDAGDPVIWGMITGVFGLVPIVGTGGIWVPLGIELIVAGNIWQGIVLILYGACVVSNVDTVVRIVVLKKHANVHPLVTLFGVILGVNLFGFWGIIFGPLLISGFFLLLRIYKSEFRQPVG
ncbi:MAG: AI-2E family transporter, partial [Bacteroidales bacterium]|nr:AI-2E family transporter [Bacteroidales bacterium]